MPSSKSSRRKSPKASAESRDSRSRRSTRSSRSSSHSDSKSTAPTSLADSPRPSDVKATKTSASAAKIPRRDSYDTTYEDDLSPATACYPRSSALTYASTTASEQDSPAESPESSFGYGYDDIPELPMYSHPTIDENVRPSTPQEFARLFPSTNRLSIRHDDFTVDGNMNLRVDTAIPGRKRRMMTLFHLRMYDLTKREFSLRRYCRDSGREVCNSKRRFDEPAAPESRPTLQRSMTTKLMSLGGKPDFRRTNSSGSVFSRSSKQRPATASSDSSSDEFARAFGRSLSMGQEKRSFAMPTNTMKLEFSNYARVDVQRRGNTKGKRYEFAWWGHKYSWKRVTDKHLGQVSFHLVRDGKDKPIAHIVPESQGPDQAEMLRQDGAWVPPCHMWINDKDSVKAKTDVADVIVATGLMALVDDCIKERWETRKFHRINVPLTSRPIDFEYVGPKAYVQRIFSRHNSADRALHSPLRYAEPAISAY